MIASHAWDAIGVQSARLTAGLIAQAGIAPLPLSGLPQPNVVAPDPPALAAKVRKLWRP